MKCEAEISHLQPTVSATLESHGNQVMFHPEDEGDTPITIDLKPEADNEIFHLQPTERATLECKGNQKILHPESEEDTEISHQEKVGDAQLPNTDSQVPAMKHKGVAETQNSTGETIK